jgi:hypothetical protein
MAQEIPKKLAKKPATKPPGNEAAIVRSMK